MLTRSSRLPVDIRENSNAWADRDLRDAVVGSRYHGHTASLRQGRIVLNRRPEYFLSKSNFEKIQGPLLSNIQPGI